MQQMKWDTIAIVGVGLIGGSIGLALKQRRLARCVVGIGRRHSRLARARRLGAVDSTTIQLERGVADAELTVVCTPVEQIADFVCRAAKHCPPGALLTDAGSTKARIVSQLNGALSSGAVFVGSHPLAGSEKQGVAHARADLFDNSVCVLTPKRGTPQVAVARVRRFWEALGAGVVQMTPEAHDRALAFTSHLPHLLAAALAGSLPSKLFDLAATGFRDTTRVAAGDPDVWAGIFTHNRQATLVALQEFQRHLARYRSALERADAGRLRKLLIQAKQNRDALGR
jgi:cyclohexadieny/prephenate dehydrogenase